MMHYFLGLEVWKCPHHIFLNQGKYTIDILKRLEIFDWNVVNTLMVINLKLLNGDYSDTLNASLYWQFIVSLMYLTNTKLNICIFVNILSEYMVEPQHVHLGVSKYVMRYLKGTLDCVLIYAAYGEFILHRFRWEHRWQE